jgi:antitoxin VapB
MVVERQVKLWRDGRSQTVWIPREFELPGEYAVIRKTGDRLIIEPVSPTSLISVLAGLGPVDEDCPPIADPEPEPFTL